MKFQFNSDGFLTDRADHLERDIQVSHGEFFDFAKQLNRECHELLCAARVRQSDGRAVLCATLFLRALEHYQATIILLSRGLVAAARAALRAMVESTFRLRALALSEDAWRTFILEDDVIRVRVMNKARTHDYPGLEGVRITATDQVVADLKQKNQMSGAKLLSIEEWSNRAGMHDWYVTNYALLSKAVHTQARDLEEYLVINQSDDVEKFRYAPSFKDIPFLTLTAAHLLLIDARAYDGVFDVGFGPKAVELESFINSSFNALDAASEVSA